MYYYDSYYNYVPFQYSTGQQSTEFENPQEVYLVDHGRIRLIVSTAVYHGIFRDWKGLIPVGLQNYPKGPSLREGTFLFKYKDSPTVYLRDWENGRTQVKRRIVSASIKLKRQRPSTEIDGLLLLDNKCIILMVFI
ncbi:hypothetical protein [Bacillus sp. TL12]|uniref:hypothetical protein n=1 Tax=Bacillus sp. TL12 TaxID=2894756 RepID=UPI001F524B0B|nr:hypothetical protein [Bacillus sp. TL12]MCI0768144.1 hypothetical protein [Bacillus sp. TL12]